MTNTLVLGPHPSPMTVAMGRGESWSASLRLLDADLNPQPWPVAPVLVLGAEEITASLSEEGALATWAVSEGVTSGIIGNHASILVDGSTKWLGRIQWWN